MLLVVPLVQCLLTNRYEWALALMFVAGFSDGLDGFLAKQFNWRSRLGGILDPVADKMLLVSSFLALAYLDLVPVWLAAIVILRDVVILSGAAAYTLTIGKVDPEPTAASKINTACQIIYVLLVIAHEAFVWPGEVAVLITGAAVLFTSVVSGLDYVLRWSEKAGSARRA